MGQEERDGEGQGISHSLIMLLPGERKFLVICKITIFSLFALILAGGIVRSSGSGMGCPDWPKCFDRYIPPVSESQLPAGYKEKYVQQRVVKNERFAKTLDLLGFAELAARIRNDKSILVPDDFNAVKTWTEYINRLIGALTGIFLIGCVVYSFAYSKLKKRIIVLSIFNVILVGFQGWLGSIVVSTNLLAWVVTVHMLLAIAIVAISIYTLFLAQTVRDLSQSLKRGSLPLKIITLMALLLTIFQITLGTGVREVIDYIASVYPSERGSWVARAEGIFSYHRDMAMGVLVVNLLLFMMIRNRFGADSLQFRYMKHSIGLMILQILTGLVLAYMSLPGYAQAMHLIVGILMFSAQFYTLLLLQKSGRIQLN